jgi:hypothetical protein
VERALRAGAYIGERRPVSLFSHRWGFCFFAPPLSTSLADDIVLNFWYRGIGRRDTTGYALLETVFAKTVKAAGIDGGGGADGGSSGAASGDHGGGDGDDRDPAFRSALVFAVRDADDDGEHDQLHLCFVNDACEH